MAAKFGFFGHKDGLRVGFGGLLVPNRGGGAGE